MNVELYLGDCLDVLPTLEANSIETIITDPPYGLEFMGKEWDHGVPGIPFWEACLRVAKPGAALCAFGGTRTHHRLMCAIEDAGWEIRDVLMWVYGSGFPKSHDISKAIDKAAGAEREVVGFKPSHRPNRVGHNGQSMAGAYTDAIETNPATPPAQLWDGWGTALKPAYEPIILAMKPRDGTFANNALAWGVAGLNIDSCRVRTNEADKQAVLDKHESFKRSRKDTFKTGWRRPWMEQGKATDAVIEAQQEKAIDALVQKGRWPANLILNETAAAMLDEQSGERRASCGGGHRQNGQSLFNTGSDGGHSEQYYDTGGASRFFYTAKASRSERESGLLGRIPCLKCGGLDTETHVDPKTGKEVRCRRNGHPTVKSLELMRWLCRLTATPTGGVVLDPFLGSGSTIVAAILEGRDAIGIEMERESFDVAEARIEAAQSEIVQGEFQCVI